MVDNGFVSGRYVHPRPIECGASHCPNLMGLHWLVSETGLPKSCLSYRWRISTGSSYQICPRPLAWDAERLGWQRGFIADFLRTGVLWSGTMDKWRCDPNRHKSNDGDRQGMPIRFSRLHLRHYRHKHPEQFLHRKSMRHRSKRS